MAKSEAMDTLVKHRFEELEQKARKLWEDSQFSHETESGEQYYGIDWPGLVAWGTSALNLVQTALGNDSIHLHELYTAYTYCRDSSPYTKSFEACWAVLQAAKEDYELSRVKNDSSGFGTSAKKHEEQVEAEEKSNRVFIVHGHDEALKHETARFLEKLGLEPIVLRERPGKSLTIIEKLEQFSRVCFAVVLLTPDDVGKGINEEGDSQPRARQNVVLELGYFLGKLGRSNVAALYQESVVLPSDYRGVEYVKIDAEGAWKMKLALELKEAGLPVDMNKVI